MGFSGSSFVTIQLIFRNSRAKHPRNHIFSGRNKLLFDELRLTIPLQSTVLVLRDCGTNWNKNPCTIASIHT